MENTTQPILCCVGQRVAGKPTQFLMERAFAAMNLDWRAITVEVDAANFPPAVTGMATMKFQAVRFFPTLQAEACKLLAAANSPLEFVGGVTSAAWSADGWTIWHNLGLAIREWANEQVDLGDIACWLQGDSLRCRSLLASFVDHVVPQAVYWKDVPKDIPSDLMRFGQNGPNPVELQCVAPGQPLDPTAMVAADNATCLLVVGDDLGWLLENPECCETFSQMLVVGTDANIRSLTSCGLPNCKFLTETEQILACEAYDFHRWTGIRVDRGLLREAYDEYSDF